MQLSFCDICQCPIKPNDKKFAMVSQEMVGEENKQYKNALEYIQDYNKRYETVKVQEICENCKKIYDHLFALRKDEIKKLNEEIRKSYKAPKLLENKTNLEEDKVDYCTCIVPYPDWENQELGENFLRCKTCGKVINPYEKLPPID